MCMTTAQSLSAADRPALQCYIYTALRVAIPIYVCALYEQQYISAHTYIRIYTRVCVFTVSGPAREK